MDLASILYLGVTFGLFAIFVVIVFRTYSKKRKEQGEIAKYRMLEDDDEAGQTDHNTKNSDTDR